NCKSSHHSFIIEIVSKFVLIIREEIMLTPSELDAKKYRRSRQDAESYIQAAMDALDTHIVMLDREGQIIMTNTAWQQFGTINDLQSGNCGIGLNYLQVCDNASSINSAEAPLVAQGIRDIIAGRRKAFELEYPCHSPQEQRWFVVRISRFDWYGELRLIVAHHNISELRLAQNTVLSSQRRIQSVLDNINNGILTLSKTGYVESANAIISKLFGYPSETLPGMHLSELLTERLDDQNALKRLNGSHGHELIGIRKDDSTFPVYFSMSELHIEDVSVYTCVIQDITLQKNMQAETLERERISVALEKERELRDLKNRFLSMMSHELKTPLASISLSYDMLNKYAHIATEEERQQALQNIRSQVDYLSAMVSDVTLLSQGESTELSLELEDTDFITYCRDVVEEYQFNYHRSHHVLFECDERNIRLSIDRRIMRRVLNNLLSNAIKYSPDGGDVIFRLRTEVNDVVIEVQDSGIGIPEEDQSRLFDPFHRAQNTGTLPGTGLGLAITKQTVERHQGDIDFKTHANGTTFIVRLPMQVD
ncbi:MAG: PAS domain-containing sensor histidine kinase, partial [Aggregatilineales bacterium]